MGSLANELSSLIASLDGDAAKFMAIARNNERYQAAVKRVWPDPEAARLILHHTNAFYVRNDDAPRKGPCKDDPYVVCEVCIGDPTVRAEIDTHRELLQLELRAEGLRFEEVRIVPARAGMKDRHPFDERS